MTKLVLEIENPADLELLLPLLERLRIRYTRKEESTISSTASTTEEAAVAYTPSYDESYLQDLIQKASQNWRDVADADEWLQNKRGYGA